MARGRDQNRLFRVLASGECFKLFSRSLSPYIYIYIYIYKLTLSPLNTGWHDAVTKIDSSAFRHLVNDSNGSLRCFSTYIHINLFMNKLTFSRFTQAGMTPWPKWALSRFGTWWMIQTVLSVASLHLSISMCVWINWRSHVSHRLAWRSDQNRLFRVSASGEWLRLCSRFLSTCIHFSLCIFIHWRMHLSHRLAWRRDQNRLFRVSASGEWSWRLCASARSRLGDVGSRGETGAEITRPARRRQGDGELNDQTLVCLSNKWNLDACKGQPFHCKLA